MIELRYGVGGDGTPVSLVEAGRRLGISADRVRKLETEALERLALEREIAALVEDAAPRAGWDEQRVRECMVRLDRRL